MGQHQPNKKGCNSYHRISKEEFAKRRFLGKRKTEDEKSIKTFVTLRAIDFERIDKIQRFLSAKIYRDYGMTSAKRRGLYLSRSFIIEEAVKYFYDLLEIDKIYPEKKE